MSEASSGWLLTMNSWFGVRKEPGSREFTHTEERVHAYYGSGSLSEALAKAREYQALNLVRYPMSGTSLRLLSFSQIPEGTDIDALVELGVTHLDAQIELLREEIADAG